MHAARRVRDLISADGARLAGSQRAATHAFYGTEAEDAEGADLRHTLPGLVINAAGSVFWGGAGFEWLFGRTSQRYGATGTVLAAMAASLPLRNLLARAGRT